ncbi:hypothetical protein FOZ60_016862 [Perkinsus olseni]|uniref:Peptidase M60 domain-containing protein n=1 Tax=Perkinsus olseni TaxID=32597 RepID=A0A7J6P4T3_PEROL|nr:hypothetical protein FOZ60_016862 [Perkinsus olseni]
MSPWSDSGGGQQHHGKQQQSNPLDAALDEITDHLDMSKFQVIGTPSTLSVFSDTSRSIIATPGPEPQCLLACATLGKGTHCCCRGMKGNTELMIMLPTDEESKVAVGVMQRARRWVARSRRAMLVRFYEDHNIVMSRNDYDVVSFRTNDLSLSNPATPQEANRLLSLVRDEGVGLLIGINGWGWECLNRGHTIAEHPMQEVALQAGICFESEYLPGQRPLTSDRRLTVLSEVSKDSFHTLIPLMKVCVVPGKSTRMGDIVLQAVNKRLHLSSEDTSKIRQLLTEAATGRWRNGDGFAPQRIPGDVSMNDVLGLAGKDFPGVCPAAAQDALSRSEGVTNEEVEVRFEAITKDTPHSSVTGRSFDPWISTGVYARPGQAIRVRLESLVEAGSSQEASKGEGRSVSMADALPDDFGFRVRIGCHKDDNTKHDSWRRWPRISAVSKDILSGRNLEVELVSVFGGLVYLERIRENGVEAGQGCRRRNQPQRGFYFDGVCTRARWGAVAVVVERSVDARRASTAGEDGWADTVTDFWDRVIRSHCDIACRPVCGEERFRFVFDVEISAGWMHSGYPIMAHENSTAEDSCAVWGDGGNLRGAHRPGKLLLEGDWGLFHELGHHFQRRRWTYKSCGEVTVNLFSMYSMMTIIGRKIPTRDMENVREGHEDAEKFIAERIRSEGRGRAIYSAAHNRSPITDALDDWSPWVGLTMYVDVIETFGWDLLRNVLRSYEKDGTYDEEPDPTEWWTRVSRACGKGLSMYCRVWGVPIDLDKMDREGGNPNDQWLPAWIQQKLIVMVWRLSYFVSCKVGDWILPMAATAAKASVKSKGKEIKTKDIRKNGKKAAPVHKEDTKKSESSSESIDDIFGALKKSTRSTSTSTKTKDTPKEQQPAAPPDPRAQRTIHSDSATAREVTGSEPRKGYKIYTEEELKIGQGGNTPDCPFDCWCCF